MRGLLQVAAFGAALTTALVMPPPPTFRDGVAAAVEETDRYVVHPSADQASEAQRNQGASPFSGDHADGITESWTRLAPASPASEWMKQYLQEIKLEIEWREVELARLMAVDPSLQDERPRDRQPHLVNELPDRPGKPPLAHQVESLRMPDGLSSDHGRHHQQQTRLSDSEEKVLRVSSKKSKAAWTLVPHRGASPQGTPLRKDPCYYYMPNEKCPPFERHPYYYRPRGPRVAVAVGFICFFAGALTTLLVVALYRSCWHRCSEWRLRRARHRRAKRVISRTWQAWKAWTQRKLTGRASPCPEKAAQASEEAAASRSRSRSSSTGSEAVYQHDDDDDDDVMASEIMSLRIASNMVADMVAAEEGRRHNHGGGGNRLSIGSLPSYRSEDLPEYEDRDGSEASSFVPDGFRYTPAGSEGSGEEEGRDDEAGSVRNVLGEMKE